MLFDTKMCAAFKNISGKYDIKDFSIFEINKLNRNFTSVEAKANKKTIVIKLRCPVCGEIHSYNYTVNDFVRREIIVGGCENFGIPLFYIGNDEKVRQHANKYNEICRQVYAMFQV